MDIWNEYKKRYPDQYLNIDGIVDNETYSQQHVKLLFILKETNQLYDSLVNFLKKGAPGGGGHTWKPICQWAEALLDGTKIEDYSKPENRANMLRRIASINIKKTPGVSTSDSSYLDCVNTNYDLLIEQIKKINPDIIVICGKPPEENTFIHQNLLKVEETIQYKQTWLYHSTWNNKIFICARHPLGSERSYIDWFIDYHKSIL